MTAGQRVLITGGTRGIGLAIAMRFADHGAEVLLNYRRDEETARAAVAAIAARGGRARALRADIGDADAVAAMFAEIQADGQRLDGLVANAAATAFKPLLEVGPHHVARTFGITVSGFVALAQHAAAMMSAGSSMVALSGFDAIRVIERHGILGPAKAALESLVRYLAVELAPRGIRVNGVSPGYIDTHSARFYVGEDFATEVGPRWAAQTRWGAWASLRKWRRWWPFLLRRRRLLLRARRWLLMVG